MPIKSYLAIPREQQKTELENVLSTLPECEIIPSENKDVIVIVTDTPNEKDDSLLFKKINSLDQLDLITLVSAFDN